MFKKILVLILSISFAGLICAAPIELYNTGDGRILSFSGDNDIKINLGSFDEVNISPRATIAVVRSRSSFSIFDPLEVYNSNGERIGSFEVESFVNVAVDDEARVAVFGHNSYLNKPHHLTVYNKDGEAIYKHSQPMLNQSHGTFSGSGNYFVIFGIDNSFRATNTVKPRVKMVIFDYNFEVIGQNVLDQWVLFTHNSTPPPFFSSNENNIFVFRKYCTETDCEDIMPNKIVKETLVYSIWGNLLQRYPGWFEDEISR